MKIKKLIITLQIPDSVNALRLADLIQDFHLKTHHYFSHDLIGTPHLSVDHCDDQSAANIELAEKINAAAEDPGTPEEFKREYKQ